MRAGEVYVNPASGERAVIILGTDETAGKRLVVDLYLLPNGGMVGRHYHPIIREQFRVLSGSLAYTLNGVKKIATVGQSVDITPGTLHDFWNPAAEEALVRVDVQPAERFSELIKNGFSLAQDGKTDRTGKPGILQIALLAREFDDVIRYDGARGLCSRSYLRYSRPSQRRRACGAATPNTSPGLPQNLSRWMSLIAPTSRKRSAPRG